MYILPTVSIVVHVCVLVEVGVVMDVFVNSCTRSSGSVDVAVGLFVAVGVLICVW